VSQRKNAQEAPGTAPAPTAKDTSKEGFPQVGELVVPIARRQRKRSLPVGDEVLVLPIPKKAAKAPRKSVPRIEELLDPVVPTPPQERQRCLALMMQSAGHSLDISCRLCFTDCVYGGTCGCGGWNCVDRTRGELVIFKETNSLSRRQRKREARVARRMERKAQGVTLWRLLKPWTWFRPG